MTDDSRYEAQPLEHYTTSADQMLKTGDPLQALETIRKSLELYPDSVRLKQLQALALARSGATLAAQGILNTLLEQGHVDSQTLGLLARTYKDLGFRAADSTERRSHLTQSLQLYKQAFELEGDLWPGVNAATLAFLLDEPDESAALTQRVRAGALSRRAGTEPSPVDAYWVQATLGEIALIQGDLEAAQAWFSGAAALSPGWGSLATTRRNARVLLRHRGLDPGLLDRCFQIPVVVVFCGHMVDRPGRARPRFPAEREGAVRAEIRARLKCYGRVIGYAPAACGADILFHEVVRELGGESHVVLPCASDEFIRESVDIGGTEDWTPRFRRVLESARQVTIASEQKGQVHHLSYDYANLFGEGLALLRSRELEADFVRMTVWDGRTGDGPGGTGAIASRWISAGYPIERIPPMPEQAVIEPPRAPQPTPVVDESMRLVFILFADALHFSALTEQQIPAFVDHFMGTVAKALECAGKPLVKNTWGDGLYLVYSNASDAGRVALSLAEAISAVDWTTHNLPAALSLRIALHSGPAYWCLDPVTAAKTFFGVHVSRAARIEPVTPPGQVYVSQAFAAVAAAEQAPGLSFEYMGRVQLAKAAGLMAMYRLSRDRFSSRV